MKKLIGIILIGVMLVGCNHQLHISGVRDITIHMRMYGITKEKSYLIPSYEREETNRVIDKDYKEKIMDILSEIPLGDKENNTTNLNGRYMCIEDNKRVIAFNEEGDLYINNYLTQSDKDIVKDAYHKICELLSIGEYGVVYAVYKVNGIAYGEYIEYYTDHNKNVRFTHDMSNSSGTIAGRDVIVDFEEKIDRSGRYSWGRAIGTQNSFQLSEDEFEERIQGVIKLGYYSNLGHMNDREIWFEKEVKIEDYLQVIDKRN